MIDKKTILLVEDCSDDVDLVTRLVWRYFGPAQSLHHCATMAEAEAYLDSSGSEICAVLLDLGLPDTANPIDTFRRLKKYAVDMPLVILTGAQDHDLALKLMEEGAEDFICKNQIFSAPDSLRNAIEFAVRRHDLLRMTDKKAEDAKAEKDMLMSWMNGDYSVQKRGNDQ